MTFVQPIWILGSFTLFFYICCLTALLQDECSLFFPLHVHLQKCLTFTGASFAATHQPAEGR